MINVIRHKDLGHHNYGWLDARYHFSFGEYRDPSRMGFGQLRVINDDIVKAGTGFDTHPHKDMEIITFVRKGAITHKDSKGNEGRTEAGNVQVMSAGSGIYHSEFNLEDIDTSLYQIWIRPKEKNIPPRWDAIKFSNRKANGSLPLLVSGRSEDTGKNALYIHQDASISGGTLEAGQIVEQPLHDNAYVLVSHGEIEVLDQTLHTGDGAEIRGQSFVKIKALTDSELILIDTP